MTATFATHKVSVQDFTSKSFYTLLANSTLEGKVLQAVVKPNENTTEYKVVQDSKLWAPEYSGSSFQDGHSKAIPNRKGGY